MSEDLAILSHQVLRRQEILDKGVPLNDLVEYNVLTLKLAEAAPTLLRAINDVTKLRDELQETGPGPAQITAKAFANEIDRALKGQR